MKENVLIVEFVKVLLITIMIPSRLIRSWCKNCCSEYDIKHRCKVIKNARNKVYMREYYKRSEVKIKYKSSERLAWRKRYRQKFKNDPYYKLTNAIRSALRQALVNKKSYSTFDALNIRCLI